LALGRIPIADRVLFGCPAWIVDIKPIFGGASASRFAHLPDISEEFKDWKTPRPWQRRLMPQPNAAQKEIS
tara:strand:- start:35 stop:247 length:213 start_codon:yes stop_codon:yes gene_type:complete